MAFHHSRIVTEELIILGLSHHYLPPYSPFLNPIENLFAQWKGLVRSMKPTTEEELFNAMAEVKNVITSEQCSNFVARTNKNCHECLHEGRDYFDN